MTSRWLASFDASTFTFPHRRRVAEAMTNDLIRQLAEAAPVNENHASVDWDGYRNALKSAGFDESAVLCASFCSFGVKNIGALIDDPQLTCVFPDGIFSSTGQRSRFGRSVKSDIIRFDRIRGFDAVDQEDPRRVGKFCIEFVGAGGVMLGRLQWRWTGKRFRDPRELMISIAEERDRVLEVIEKAVGASNDH